MRISALWAVAAHRIAAMDGGRRRRGVCLRWGLTMKRMIGRDVLAAGRCGDGFVVSWQEHVL